MYCNVCIIYIYVCMYSGAALGMSHLLFLIAAGCRVAVSLKTSYPRPETQKPQEKPVSLEVRVLGDIP